MEIALTGTPSILSIPARPPVRADDSDSSGTSEGFASHLRDAADDRSEAAPRTAPVKKESKAAARPEKGTAIPQGKDRGNALSNETLLNALGAVAPDAADPTSDVANPLKDSAALLSATLAIASKQPGEDGKPGEMAFAIKVKPAAKTQEAVIEDKPLALKAAGADPIHQTDSAGGKESGGQEEAGQGGAEDRKGVAIPPGTSFLAVAAGSDRSDRMASVHESASPAQTNASTDVQATHLQEAPKNTTPLKELTISVGQPDSRVNVRIVERSGELHIAVSAGGVETTNALRQNLSELSQRLAENGYRSEAWHSGSPAAAATPETGSANTSTANHHNDPNGQQEHPQQDGGRRGHHQSAKPRWVEELETSSKPGPKKSGDLNGITN